MLKKMFKKTDAKKTVKVEKISKKEMNQVIGGAETTTTIASSTSVHQELHRPCTA